MTVPSYYLAPFPRYLELFVKFLVSTFLWCTHSGESLTSGLQNLVSRTRDIIIWSGAKHIDILKSLKVTHQCDRQRNGQTDILLANTALNYAAQPKMQCWHIPNLILLFWYLCGWVLFKYIMRFAREDVCPGTMWTCESWFATAPERSSEINHKT